MQTILAVDDSASMRQLLAHTLRHAGYRVLEAGDGLQAIDLASREPIDAVITDQNMPRMDGLALTAALRARPGQRRIPILILTTESDTSIKEAARQAGATGWLLKPFDPMRLVQLLSRLAPAPGAAP